MAVVFLRVWMLRPNKETPEQRHVDIVGFRVTDGGRLDGEPRAFVGEDGVDEMEGRVHGL